MQPTVPITPEVLQNLDHEFRSLRFIPVSSLQVENGRLVVVPEGPNSQRESLLMNMDAKKYLASFLGCPSELFEKIDDPALVSMIWNYYINGRGSDITVLKAVVKGESVEAFTTRSFQAIPPSGIIQACQAGIADAVLERQPYLGPKAINFHLTGPDLYENFEQNLGGVSDVHHFSVGVSYNFMGDGSPTMRTFGHRHHCGNIMESAYGIGGKQFRIFTTEPELVMTKFTEFTRKGVEFVRSTMIPHIRATMQARLEDPLQELNDLANQTGMTERIQELVAEAYRTEDLGGTRYHLINALTRAANSDRCPTNWIERLRQIAGEATVKYDPAVEPKRCNSCHQKIKKGQTHSH